MRLRAEHHKILKDLAGVYGSQQKAIEYVLDHSITGDGYTDPVLLEVRRKILSHPRVCMIDRDILDAVINGQSSGIPSLLTGALTTFVAGTTIEETKVGDILGAMKLLFTASRLFEGVSVEYESENGTYLVAFHYDCSIEYARLLFVEPLRYLLAAKGIEPSVKLSQNYGYMVVHELKERDGQED